MKRRLNHHAMPPKPHVFWLFGLSGAGKTTLASALRRTVPNSLMLDGDRLRAGLCQGLDFTTAGRNENLRRAAEVARLGLESGLVVIASFITPLREQREMIRKVVSSDRISFILVDTTPEICGKRDIKGLYGKARRGLVTHMAGLGSPFEPEGSVDFHLSTKQETPEQSAWRLMRFAQGVLGVSPDEIST